MPLKVWCGPFHPELEDAFLGRLPSWGPEGGLITAVVCPSRAMADRLERLAALEKGRSLLMVRFHTFHSLAIEIVSDAGACPARLLTDGLFHDRLVDSILGGRGKRLSRGLAGAFRSSLRDLVDAGIEPGPFRESLDELVKAEPDRSRLAELLDLLEEYLAALEAAGVMPPAGLAVAAAEAVDSGRAGRLARYGRFLYYGFYDLTGRQADFFEAMSRAFPAEVFFPYRKGHPAFRFCDKLFELKLMAAEPVYLDGGGQGRALAGALDRLFVPGKRGDKPGVQPALMVIAASGATGEAWAVAKEIIALHEREESPVPYADIGVVARTLEPYRAALAGAFRDNGIPFSMEAAAPLLSHPIAKLCHALLSLRRLDFPAASVVELARSPYFKIDKKLAADWAALVGFLGVRSGWLQWEGKLAGRLGADIELDPHRAREEGQGRLVAGRDAAALWDLLTSLRERLGRRFPTWRESADDAVALLEERFLVLPGDPGLPAWDAVREAVSSLAAFDLAGGPRGDDFLDAVDERLRRAALEPPAGCQGVRVLDAMSARGESFRALFLVGLNEGLFPRQVAEDPLLAESVRLRLRDVGGYWIHPKLDGYAEERLLFWLMAASARERLVCSFQRSDEDGNAGVPSVYLRELCAAEGVPLEERVSTVPRQPFARLEALDRGLLSPKEACLLLARGGSDPAATFETLGLDLELFLSCLEHAEALNGRGEPGSLDGVIGPAGHFRRFREKGLSPSGLESFGRCPFRFFASSVLGLAGEEEAPGRSDFDSRAKGNLYHLVLRAFHEALVARGFWRGEPVSWEKVLEECADTVLGGRAAAGLGLYPLLWEAERRKMLRHLGRTAAEDIGRLKAQGLVPSAFEAEASAEVGGRKVRGRLDRVDRTAGGDFLVVDYKTSWPRSRDTLEKLVLSLRAHQPPLYMELAGEGAQRGGRPLGCRFIAIEESERTSGAPGVQEVGGRTWERFRPAYLEGFAGLVRELERGRFFITPDEERGGPCPDCAFPSICRKAHPASRRRAERSKMRAEHDRLFAGRAAAGPEESVHGA